MAPGVFPARLKVMAIRWPGVVRAPTAERSWSFSEAEK
jgi:hypothetical protein